MLILIIIKHAKWHSIILDHIREIRQFLKHTKKPMSLFTTTFCFLTHPEDSVI